MNRRKFFAFLPLAPVAAVAAVEEAKAKSSQEGAPNKSTTSLVLQGTDVVVGPRNQYGMITIHRNPNPAKQVSMAVGDDGSLWIKNTNQEWKRVVTE